MTHHFNREENYFFFIKSIVALRLVLNQYEINISNKTHVVY